MVELNNETFSLMNNCRVSYTKKNSDVVLLGQWQP